MKQFVRYFMSIALIVAFVYGMHAENKETCSSPSVFDQMRFISDTYLVSTNPKDKKPVLTENEEAVDIPKISKEDANLIALVTMAEAEGECEEGKRLVIDTILNRVDHANFPNTIRDVIYQKNQFTSMWNGRVDRCYVRDDILELVYQEVESRYNADVIFFRTGRYSSYGVPLFKIGNHYFSKY